MSEMTQNIIVFLVIAAAVAYVAWNLWRTFAGRRGNCGCSSGKAGCARMEQARRDMEQAGKGKKVELH